MAELENQQNALISAHVIQTVSDSPTNVPMTANTSPELLSYQQCLSSGGGTGSGSGSSINGHGMGNSLMPTTNGGGHLPHHHHHPHHQHGQHSLSPKLEHVTTVAGNASSITAATVVSGVSNPYTQTAITAHNNSSGATNTGGLMPHTHAHAAHTHHTHLNMNLSAAAAAQSQMMSTAVSQSPHVPHTQVMAANIYSTIGQPYAGENSNFGAIYHHQHYHSGYGSPYDKLKVTSHMRQSPASAAGSPTAMASAAAANAYGISSYQSFYGSPHQMMRPNGYMDLVPR